MEASTFIVIMALCLVGMAWWANASKRNKIYCTYRRINKTKVARFVKMSSRYIIFEGSKFDIIPSCITFVWWDKGIHMLFPQWVATLDYSYNSRFPIDPNTLEPAIISPEVRAVMNKEEWTKSYAKGFTPPTAKKQSMLQQYLPLISVVLIVLVGFYLYTNMQGLANEIATMKNTLQSITR